MTSAGFWASSSSTDKDTHNYDLRPALAVFGKTKCRLCGDSVRLALKHLRDSHPEIYDREVKKMRMPEIMKKYFIE